MRLLHAFAFAWVNQSYFCENANACSKRTLKTGVATSLKIKFPDLQIENLYFLQKSLRVTIAYSKRREEEPFFAIEEFFGSLSRFIALLNKDRKCNFVTSKAG